MRLAMLSDAVFPTPWDQGHGLGRMVFNLGREFVRRGHEVTLLGLQGSALDGARVLTTSKRAVEGEGELAQMVLERAGEFDAFVDTSHGHALAVAEAGLPGLAWFADIASRPAPCPVFVSKWARAQTGQDGPVVHNAIALDEFSLHTGERAGLLWMALNTVTKGLGTARIVAQMAGMQLDAYGAGTPNGAISGAEKIAALQQHTALLFPSTNDAGPQTPLEALACGTPVVALNRVGTVEYVPAGGGYLCDTAAEMAARVRDAAQMDPASVRQSVIDGGFIVERQAAEMERLLERVRKGARW